MKPVITLSLFLTLILSWIDSIGQNVNCSDCVSGINSIRPAYTVSTKKVKSLGSYEYKVTVTNHCNEARWFTLRALFTNSEVDAPSANNLKSGGSYTFTYYKEIKGFYLYDKNNNCKDFGKISGKDHLDKWNYHPF